MASKGKSILHKLAIREKTGLWKRHRKQPGSLLFEKIPGRMCYQLKKLVSQTVLENGHVFLGFSKCGKFVISYSLQVGSDQTSDRMLPVYDYKLQWWLFIPNKPLQLASEIKLFTGDDIFKELFIAFCEWPEDDSKIFVYGQSIPSHGDDSCFCYVTITAVPCLGKCLDCQEERSVKTEGQANEESESSDTKSERKCLSHGFCVHSKYDMNPPYPAFSPGVQLKLDGTVILNTGISLVAFQVELPQCTSFSKNKYCDNNISRTIIGSDLSLTVLKTINSVSSSPNSRVPYKSCQECQTSPCTCAEYEENHDSTSQNIPISSPSSNTVGFEFVGDSESIMSIDIIDKAKDYMLCDHCCQISSECTCPKIIRQPLQDKNSSSRVIKNCEQSSSLPSPRSNIPSRYLFEGTSDPTDNATSSNFERIPNYVFSSPSPRICSERSFFSPSNTSNSSVASKSSEGVHIHTNLAKTVTYSSRYYSTQPGEVSDSQVSMEDEYDLAYRSILPVDACANGKALSIAKNVCSSEEVLSVLQMTFDIEPYMMETIHLRADWGRRFVSFYNYDLQILDVEQDGLVLGTVFALVQAKESTGIEKSKRHSKIPIKMYHTQLTFCLNLNKGIYSTLNIDDLTEVQERKPYEFEWKSGNTECNLMRRKALLPKSFFRSVHMLSNECLFKGRSKKILMASHHSHTSAIIL